MTVVICVYKVNNCYGLAIDSYIQIFDNFLISQQCTHISLSGFKNIFIFRDLELYLPHSLPVSCSTIGIFNGFINQWQVRLLFIYCLCSRFVKIKAADTPHFMTFEDLEGSILKAPNVHMCGSRFIFRYL